MEVRDIEYFGVIAEHGNLRRASEALKLSPPALSKSLKRLEDAMQARLVERTGKGVRLTPVGAAVAAQARRMRLTLDDITREAADMSRGRAGHLRIGASPVDCEHLPRPCATLLRESPKLTFEITVSDNDVMVPLLQEGRLDVIFNYIPPRPYDGLRQEPIYDDAYSVFASSGHPLTKARRVPLPEVADEGWVMSTDHHRPIHVLKQTFAEHGVGEPRFVVQTRSLRLRLQMVAASNLLCYGSVGGHRAAFAGLKLKPIAVKELSVPKPVGAMYRRDAYLPPAARRLIDLFKLEMQNER